MKYRKLGNTGTSVSNLALGAMDFGTKTDDTESLAGWRVSCDPVGGEPRRLKRCDISQKSSRHRGRGGAGSNHHPTESSRPMTDGSVPP
jgi:hypothetical protein